MASVVAEYIVSTPAQFWSELEETASVKAKASLEEIDLALRTYVYFCARYYNDYLGNDRDLDQAVQMLLDSHFFVTHSDRMVNLAMDLVETRQSQDPQDSTTKLHILLRLLMTHGNQKPHVFKLLRQPRLSATQHTSRPFIQMLIEVLNRTEEEAHATGEESSVEGMVGMEATEMLYEVLRVKRLTQEELPLFEQRFIEHLFEIVEQTRDGDEQYNYGLIRLIIALNEQFMVAGLDESAPASNGHHAAHKKGSLSTDSQNLVLRILKNKLGESKTFGENLIFILNRLNSSAGESTPEDLCVSLLILKILYLLFSTASTSEYFYTNDLRVLVDVFIRELLDLPEESEGLRHTYLRVLHPLMNNTQLRTYPYKHEAIRATLLCLLSDDHIRAVSPTTRRLVERNLKADWCVALDPPASAQAVEEEAQIAKEMSTIALKGPAASLRVEQSQGSHGSSTSVNAVAGAEQMSSHRPPPRPPRNRKISLGGLWGKGKTSSKEGAAATSSSEKSKDRENGHASPPGKEQDATDKRPLMHRIRRPSRSVPTISIQQDDSSEVLGRLSASQDRHNGRASPQGSVSSHGSQAHHGSHVHHAHDVHGVHAQHPHHRHHSPRNDAPLADSLDTLLPGIKLSKKGKVPPPRPPKSGQSARGSRSLPGTPPSTTSSSFAPDDIDAMSASTASINSTVGDSPGSVHTDTATSATEAENGGFLKGKLKVRRAPPPTPSRSKRAAAAEAAAAATAAVPQLPD